MYWPMATSKKKTGMAPHTAMNKYGMKKAPATKMQP
jgi:hypothetical protein